MPHEIRGCSDSCSEPNLDVAEIPGPSGLLVFAISAVVNSGGFLASGLLVYLSYCSSLFFAEAKASTVTLPSPPCELITRTPISFLFLLMRSRQVTAVQILAGLSSVGASPSLSSVYAYCCPDAAPPPATCFFTTGAMSVSYTHLT